MDNNLCDMKCINKGLTADIYETKEHKILKLFFEDTYEPRKTREYEILKNISIKSGSKLKVPNVYETVKINNRDGFFMDKYSYSSLEKKYWFRLIEKVRKTASVCQQIRSDISIEGDCDIKDFIRPIVEEAELSIHIKDFLHKTLDDLPNGNYACHGDLHSENILLCGEDEYMLIDWSEGGKGDYLFEIAKILTVYQYHPYAGFEDERIDAKGVLHQITYKVNKNLLDIFLKEMSKDEKIDMERLQQWQMILDTMVLKNMEGKRSECVYNKIQLSYERFR